jgi:hypothetical protein
MSPQDHVCHPDHIHVEEFQTPRDDLRDVLVKGLEVSVQMRRELRLAYERGYHDGARRGMGAGLLGWLLGMACAIGTYALIHIGHAH